MYEQTIRVNRSVLDVYDFLLDVGRLWQFVPYYIHTAVTKQDQQGWPTEFKALVGVTKELAYTTNITISERDRGHAISFRSDEPPQSATYVLQPSESGTVITATHSPWQIPGAELYQVWLDAFYLRYLNDVMTSLKRHIEGQPPSNDPIVFLSYRRSAAGYVAGRLIEALNQEFGPQAVFQDSRSIDAGEHAQQRIMASIEKCVASIVLVDNSWVDELRRREQGGDADWVREEVRTAISLNKPLIPVALAGVTHLPPEGIPDDMRDLLDRQWQTLRVDPEFGVDVQRIVDSIWKLVKEQPPRARIQTSLSDEMEAPEEFLQDPGLTGVLSRLLNFYSKALGNIFDMS